MIPFKCDLNLAVNIITVLKVSGGHGHAFQFHFIWILLGGCGRMS